MNLRWLFWWRPPCLLRTVIVNAVAPADISFRGVLWQSRGAWLTLKDAAALQENKPAAPIDGDFVIHRSNVAFMQVLP
jgi:hypothetical protein